MAINELVYDLENRPNVSKTVTLDLKKVIPIDNQGDEVYVLSASTSAKKHGSATINPVYIREFKSGYCKSSGHVAGPFNIDVTNNKLNVSLDGSLTREITLASGVGLSGEDIASDIQTKLSALAAVSGVEQDNAAFLNCNVAYDNNRFTIVTGSMSNTYTGVGKSSALVLISTSGDARSLLGFDKQISSELISAKRAVETLVSSGYTSGLSISVETVSGMAAGDAFTIFNGLNREYFVTSGVAANELQLHYSLSNIYPIGSVIQKIFERDPDSDVVNSPHDTVDKIMRFGLMAIANQIDFSI
jgi:hypothetical protein